ncbi:MAG TPA: BrnA antitoxin family protein [Candidatus Polarisedimenticolia bacterium]|nr:BrnA antitoxin family protein [Candidatus Polarisedimenticolia bacterium]
MKKEYDFSSARRGPVVKSSGKTRITIFLDDDILDAFRKRAEASGRGYQTMINEALRTALAESPQGIDAQTIRRIIREETAAYRASGAGLGTKRTRSSRKRTG